MTRAHRSVLTGVVKGLTVGLGLIVNNTDPENPIVSFDINQADLEEGNTLVWDEAAEKFIPGEGGGSGSGEPVGRISVLSGLNPDPGCIEIGQGGSFDRASLPDLAVWMDNNGTALGLTVPQIAAGNLPNWQGRVARTTGGLGPAQGALQEDALQGHWHQNRRSVAGDANFLTFEGGTGGNGYASGTANVGSSQARELISDGINGTPRTATETRVKSFGVRWQIRAFGTSVNEGLVDLVAIQQDLQNLRNNAFTRANILGTVSQSSGTPTGAIIERGSNANGEWIKFADGTLICWGNGSVNTTSGPYTAGWNTSVYYGQPTVTFPSAFRDTLYTLTGNATNRGAVSLLGFTRTTSTFQAEIVDRQSTSTVQWSWCAIGRWF